MHFTQEGPQLKLCLNVNNEERWESIQLNEGFCAVPALVAPYLCLQLVDEGTFEDLQ